MHLVTWYCTYLLVLEPDNTANMRDAGLRFFHSTYIQDVSSGLDLVFHNSKFLMSHHHKFVAAEAHLGKSLSNIPFSSISTSSQYHKKVRLLSLFSTETFSRIKGGGLVGGRQTSIHEVHVQRIGDIGKHKTYTSLVQISRRLGRSETDTCMNQPQAARNIKEA